MRQSLFVSFLFAFFSPLLTAQAQVSWWQEDFSAALAASKDSTAEMLLLYFWRDPHDNCKAMFGGTLADEKVVPVMNEFVCMGAQADTDVGKPLFEMYKIQNVPTVLFVKSDGKVVDLISGYVPVADFLAEVVRIKSGKETVAALREAVAKDPTDFKVGLQLVNKLRATGDAEAALEVIDAIVAKDPKLRNEFAAEAMLIKIRDKVFAPDVTPMDRDLEPLRAFLAKQKNKRIKFMGYDLMATAEYGRDNLKDAAKHAEKAWKNIPKDEVLDWGQRMASLAYRRHEDLSKIDKGFLKLAMKISDKALTEVEKEVKKSPDNAFHANALFLHAAVLVVNNKRKEAFAAMDKAIELNPKDENLKEWKKRWVKGEK